MVPLNVGALKHSKSTGSDGLCKQGWYKFGMVRDITGDKIDYLLIRDGSMFKRWAIHLTTGAKIYGKRNWMKADGKKELQHFKESASRHFEQWLNGETDEDHASAVFFNINGAEHVKEKLNDK